ncbi:MAG: C39 family peptidase, partial [Balneolaceae bacterium]|nr:C39 family peptidase [Balneolaceae bacterium]
NLHTIYSYYGDPISLAQVIREVPALPGGGTLGAWLATHALGRGYRIEIYSYNLNLFDPTWFERDSDFIRNKLLLQKKFKQDAKLRRATDAYVEFLDRNGCLRHAVLNRELIRRYLERGIPVLVGLSATYLYNSAREYGPYNSYDDLRGEPTGHFVVLYGYNQRTSDVSVADPLHGNPLAGGPHYEVEIDRVINAVLLGIVTYDANLVIISPGAGAE